MAQERKPHSRYIFNRDLETLWRGDPAQAGSQYRSIAITSDQFNSTQGLFQIIALEGVGKGIESGKFAGTKNDPHVLCDEDFSGLDAAADKFAELVKQAQSSGFKSMSVVDMVQHEETLGASKDF